MGSATELFRHLALPIAALVLATTALDAQQRERSPIATGRPSFATGPGIVPSLQVESGYRFSESAAAIQHAVGQLMVRAPVFSWVEFRAGLGSLVVCEAPAATTRGLQDITVRTKIRLLTAGATGAWFPGVALVTSSSLPTGAAGFGAAQAQPAANLILAWPLGERAQLLSNTVGRSLLLQGERVGEFAQGLFLGYNLPGPLGSFVEVHRSRAQGRDLSASVAGGLTLHLSNDLQLDVHGGRGVTDAADDFYLGAGLGWRR
jgi:hypothetical protein